MKTTDIFLEIGNEIEKNRRIRKWTQKELAVKSGLDIKTICKFEKGQGNPLITTLLKIINAFDMLLSEFFLEVEKRIKMLN
ncbi:helix-turn-helix domain-containing protein [Niallia sp. Krafla_26]|uniref:helix-turn-helix domain-containing protein n=1 Tax=Niallia sp. Krafla_26 TaxID=3064703 RepID=UPI003D17DBE3